MEWNVKRDVEKKVAELHEALVDMVVHDGEMPPSEVLAQVKARKQEHNLPERCACARGV